MQEGWGWRGRGTGVTTRPVKAGKGRGGPCPGFALRFRGQMRVTDTARGQATREHKEGARPLK